MKNIYSIIRSSTARRNSLILDNGCFSHLHQRYYGSIHTIFHQIACWFRIPWTAPWLYWGVFSFGVVGPKQQYSMARIFFFIFLALAKFKTWNKNSYLNPRRGFPLLLTVMLPSNRFHRFYELPQDAQSDWNQCVYYFKFTWIKHRYLVFEYQKR
jgi:hypothetical protein